MATQQELALLEELEKQVADAQLNGIILLLPFAFCLLPFFSQL